MATQGNDSIYVFWEELGKQKRMGYGQPTQESTPMNKTHGAS